MPDKIYILIDHANGRARTPSLETLSMGQAIAAATGGDVHAVVLGNELGTITGQLSSYQLGSVIAVQDERLAEYAPDFYTHALVQILKEDQPNLLLFAHTYQNIDLAPRVAARMRTALVTDCIGFKADGGKLLFTRQMFRSKLNADVVVNSPRPWLVSMQAGAFSVDTLKSGSAPVASKAVDLTSVEAKRKTTETIQATKGKVDLTRADIIVGVGRGIKKPENLGVVQDLANALGGEVGASRPVVDNEWLERERQIGSSGQNVSPKLYVACGISGAIQHIVGMKNSGCIVAINTDPNAPIFNVASYGIVGDVMEVVPALTKRIKQEKGM